jgi:hypothetical protein
MPLHVEVAEGSAKGRKVEIPIGKTITIGRTSKSMLAFPEDDCMSGLHFALGLSNGSLRLKNLSKTNGTEVNGQKLDSIFLKPGDRIKAGQTIFSVIGPPPSPYPVQLRIGGWGFEALPDGWEAVEGSGFRHSVTTPFRPNMLAVEEQLPKGQTLPDYVKLQMDLARKHIEGVELSDPVPAKIKGAEQAMGLTIRTPVRDKGIAIQHQVYALHLGIVGVFTATALESQAQILRQGLGAVLKGISFVQT